MRRAAAGRTTGTDHEHTELPRELRLTGVVEAGVEAGCLILRPDSGSVYLLLGGDSTVLLPGRRVTVRGLPQPDRATTCMQGIPFEVREATPIQPVG